jgi:dTDP-4-dehydrorhamnose reductase
LAAPPFADASGRIELRGVFHVTGSGEATWADFAEAIFVEAAARGRRLSGSSTSRRPTTQRLRSVQPIRVSTMKS